MTAIVFSTAPTFMVSLDPVRSEDRVPSVAFDVLVEVSMPNQQARISSKERWFTHAALNSFEDQLLELCSAEAGSATLLDMSDRPMMRIIRNGDRIETIVQVTDTIPLFATTVQANGDAWEIPVMHEQLSSYAKWW